MKHVEGPHPVDTNTGMIYNTYIFYLLDNNREKALPREIKRMWN